MPDEQPLLEGSELLNKLTVSQLEQNRLLFQQGYDMGFLKGKAEGFREATEKLSKMGGK